MRWLLGALALLLILLVLHIGGAVVSLGTFIAAVRAQDAPAILARTDMPRLRTSLANQIVSAYLNRDGSSRPVKPLQRLAANVIGGSLADALLAKLLTADAVAKILKQGEIPAEASGVTAATLPALGSIDPSKTLQLLARLRPVKLVEFAVRVGDSGGDDDTEINFHFDMSGWKLSGIRFPQKTLRELATRLPAR